MEMLFLIGALMISFRKISGISDFIEDQRRNYYKARLDFVYYPPDVYKYDYSIGLLAGENNKIITWDHELPDEVVNKAKSRIWKMVYYELVMRGKFHRLEDLPPLIGMTDVTELEFFNEVNEFVERISNSNKKDIYEVNSNESEINGNKVTRVFLDCHI